MATIASRISIRPMTLADIPRVSEIEHESFPTMWPQTAYKREIQRNNLAAYLVLCEDRPEADAPDEQQEAPAKAPAQRDGRGLRGALQRLSSLLFEPRSGERGTLLAGEPSRERILGFIGLWFMVGEAHIVTIAVAQSERRRGFGEALLIAAFDLAMQRNQDVLTLECRVSNAPAQALYEKYGFRRVGVRKRYYTDNNEDALIMTTFPIDSDEVKAQFEQLRSAYVARHGQPNMTLPDMAV